VKTTSFLFARFNKYLSPILFTIAFLGVLLLAMKKIKTSHVPQNSKISDFFSKVPNNQPIKNGLCENKRKLIDLKQSPESVVLNSVTNLPPKCNQSTSPNCKKIKCDENCFPSGKIIFLFKCE
jgi:hypothetical protein